MKIITGKNIRALNINARECVDWIIESFATKSEAQLPAKISCHPADFDFFTSMPCLLPENKRGNRYFGIKEVHRIEGAIPSLGSDMLLYDAKTGELLALIDCDWKVKVADLVIRNKISKDKAIELLKSSNGILRKVINEQS